MADFWQPVKKRMVAWEGKRPKPGDTLQNTRNRYQVLSLTDGLPFTITCMRLPPDAPDSGDLFGIRSIPRSATRRKSTL